MNLGGIALYVLMVSVFYGVFGEHCVVFISAWMKFSCESLLLFLFLLLLHFLLLLSRIDVTEVQIFIISLYLLAAFGGTAFWQYVIPVLNIQIKIIPAIFTLLGAVFSCTNYFRVIFTGGMGKNGSTIAGTSVLSPAFHIAVVISLALLTYKMSSERLFQTHPCLYVLTFGFVSAKITNRLVVAHMTKSEMHRNDLAFLSPLLLCLNQYFSYFSEHLLLWVALVLSGSDLVCYCVSVCKQIAAQLNISVFSLRKPESSKQDYRNNH
ncbi:choline/ethanolaminephosphotransferase 1a [Salminus brasiliensis]|uniref:choline/ethanolaminephosphotransferase 1a n=1 Tax=Salminus brasiliensis TaxID=930266 RepID=UPI003B82E5C4